MKIIKLAAICHFGLEAVTRREVENLGYDVVEVSDGRVIFEADFDGLIRANMFLRTVERIMILLAEFNAYSFEELFDNVYKIRWEEYVPEDGQFPITKATSVRSKLYSTRDIQSICKKAIANRLTKFYTRISMEESGAKYPVRISILKDKVSVYLDSSGESLHKRGYRTFVSKAPMSETLAASIIMLTPYNKDRLLIDPFCGSGTIPIEAAMIAKNIAPGIKRKFVSMDWTNLISKKEWILVREEAFDEIVDDRDIDIQAYDIDFRILKGARANAQAMGCDNIIHFQERDIADFSSRKKYGFVITNPPYGIRLEDTKEVSGIYRTIGKKIREFDTWSFYILSGYNNIEDDIGKKATKNRKIYNGMLKTYLYQYLGKKPVKNERNNNSNIE